MKIFKYLTLKDILKAIWMFFVLFIFFLIIIAIPVLIMIYVISISGQDPNYADIPITDIISSASAVIAAFVIFVAVFQYHETKKANMINVTHKCMAEYRRISRDIQRLKPVFFSTGASITDKDRVNSKVENKYIVEKEILIRDLIHLLEEESEYCKKGYTMRSMEKTYKESFERHLRNEDSTTDWLKLSDYMSNNPEEFNRGRFPNMNEILEDINCKKKSKICMCVSRLSSCFSKGGF